MDDAQPQCAITAVPTAACAVRAWPAPEDGARPAIVACNRALSGRCSRALRIHASFASIAFERVRGARALRAWPCVRSRPAACVGNSHSELVHHWQPYSTTVTTTRGAVQLRRHEAMGCARAAASLQEG